MTVPLFKKNTVQAIAEPYRDRSDLPLVIDLDGTLLNSDMLVESFFSMMAVRPLAALKACLSLRKGRAELKANLAKGATFDIANLPWNEAVLAYLRRERQNGRQIYLASASDRHLVQAVADHLQLFDGCFASDGIVNLKSAAKAELLCRIFGEHGFVYAGNEDADVAVWDKAAGVIVVNAKSNLIKHVKHKWPDALIIDGQHLTLAIAAKAIRLHQWLKNLLLFVPLLAAHNFNSGAVITCTLAFLSFSLCASSVYVLNDLIDLDRDRAHPTKRNRPFAKGTLPLTYGLAMAPVLLIAAFALTLPIGSAFVAVLLGYYVLTLSYSLALKREMMIDVVALACLYGVRIVAGAVAIHSASSAWLAAFSLFFFCSLALVKRCTELTGDIARGVTSRSGRAYRAGDLPLLEGLAAASGFTAVQVFALYVSSDVITTLYSSPRGLWLICIVLIYWIGRILILSHRGEMNDDPVVFATTDRVSQICGLVVIAIVLASL